MKTIQIVGGPKVENLLLEKELFLKGKLMNQLISSQDTLFNRYFKTRGENSQEEFKNAMSSAGKKLQEASIEMCIRFDIDETGKMKDPYTLYKLKEPITVSTNETTNEGTKVTKHVYEHIAIKKSQLASVAVKDGVVDLKKNGTIQSTFYRITEDQYNANKMSFKPVYCLTLQKDAEASADASAIFLNFRKRVEAKL